MFVVSDSQIIFCMCDKLGIFAKIGLGFLFSFMIQVNITTHFNYLFAVPNIR